MSRLKALRYAPTADAARTERAALTRLPLRSVGFQLRKNVIEKMGGRTERQPQGARQKKRAQIFTDARCYVSDRFR